MPQLDAKSRQQSRLKNYITYWIGRLWRAVGRLVDREVAWLFPTAGTSLSRY